MDVNEQIAIDHGLKSDEYKKICQLLKRTPNITELGIFPLCGMNIVHISRHDFTLKNYQPKESPL